MDSDISVLQFKVTLKGSKPPIWRRFLIPTAATFHQLHGAIQDVMGWYDCHLHMFMLGGWGEMSISNPEHWDEPQDQSIDERITLVTEFLSEPGDRIDYVYDMGDGWDHAVVLEKVLPASGKTLPRCIMGKRACPPEDIGGISSYQLLCQYVRDPDSVDVSQREWMRELAEDIELLDPELFNPKDIDWATWESAN